MEVINYAEFLETSPEDASESSELRETRYSCISEVRRTCGVGKYPLTVVLTLGLLADLAGLSTPNRELPLFWWEE